MSDNAQEFRSATFAQTVAARGARHRFIRAGRPQTNGGVERVQQTILDECWKPAFARSLIPSRPACAWIWNAISATTDESQLGLDRCRPLVPESWWGAGDDVLKGRSLGLWSCRAAAALTAEDARPGVAPASRLPPALQSCTSRW
jgi:transposase InsO family protein